MRAKGADFIKKLARHLITLKLQQIPTLTPPHNP